jgi:HEXXH motif-containing protein
MSPRAFLGLPGPDDDTARTLAERVRTVAFKQLVAHDRRALPRDLAAALAPLQARAYQLATGDPAARAGLARAFEDLDVQTCALALGTAHAEAAARTLGPRLIARAAAEGIALPWPYPPAPITDAHLHPISPRVPAARLATIDHNPLRFVEAHPDKHGNALDLGGHDLATWQAALDDALALIAAALPALVPELGVTLRRIVPIGFDAERHLSCSYREAPGLVYLSLHPHPLTMAEAIVHETQHAKLNLLSWLDPILANPPDERVASPARPDLRPLFGVLLAVHAFVPVAWLHHQLAALDHPIARGPEFARRRAQVLDGNAAGLRTLHEHARPTATGAKVVKALVELDLALR